MRKSHVLLTSLILLLMVIGPVQAQAISCGQLAAVKGPDVAILRLQTAGETVRYATRVEENKVVPVECDDVIQTGKDSSAKVILANSKLCLGPETRIELAGHIEAAEGSSLPRVNLLNLTYGKLRALVNRVSGKKKTKDETAAFSVRTYSAVAGVRGTDFYTSFEPNAGLTEQATLEGAVEVEQSGTTQKVLVAAGKEVSVAAAPGASEVAGHLPAPKQVPSKGSEVRPLKVVPMREEIKQAIRNASLVARDDKDFASPKAVEALGKPDTWTIEREKVPDRLNGIKNEF